MTMSTWFQAWANLEAPFITISNFFKRILLFMVLQLGSALQVQSPFARFYIDGSAAAADRDIGLGVTPDKCYEAAAWYDAPTASLFHVPIYNRECRLGEAGNPGPGFDSEAKAMFSSMTLASGL